MSYPYNEQYQQNWNTSDEVYTPQTEYYSEYQGYYNEYPEYYSEYPSYQAGSSLDQTTLGIQGGYGNGVYRGADTDSFDLHYPDNRESSLLDRASYNASSTQSLRQDYSSFLSGLPAFSPVTVIILKVMAAVIAVEMFRVTCYTRSCSMTPKWKKEYVLPDVVISVVLACLSSSLWRLRQLTDIVKLSLCLVLPYSSIETFHNYSSSLFVLASHALETFCLLAIMLSVIYAIELLCGERDEELYGELKCQPESCPLEQTGVDSDEEANEESAFVDSVEMLTPVTTRQKLHKQLDTEQKKFRELDVEKRLLQEEERNNKEQLEEQLEILGRNLLYCSKTRQKKDIMMPHLNKHRAVYRKTHVPAVPPPSASSSPEISLTNLYYINVTDL